MSVFDLRICYLQEKFPKLLKMLKDNGNNQAYDYAAELYDQHIVEKIKGLKNPTESEKLVAIKIMNTWEAVKVNGKKKLKLKNWVGLDVLDASRK